MAQEGFLVLSDITGYSTYLNESELEHARESLTDLLNLLIERTRSPLEIFKLEGDAVFSYAPEGSFIQGQTLLEAIENTYLAFRKALELMIINTTCQCNACRNIPNLDLKFFIHYGSFTMQDLGDYRELLGNDVNLVHRITKNQISDEFGLRAYAAYTKAVVDALQMTDLSKNMLAHIEAFDDVGKVHLYVHDMHGVWEARSKEVRITVEPEEAIVVLENYIDIPPITLWDYVTKPEYRSILYDSDSQTVSKQTNSRNGIGSEYICAHGEIEAVHTVLDWQPFEQYTVRQNVVNEKFSHLATTKLIPSGDGTRFLFFGGRITGPKPGEWLVNFIYPIRMKKDGPARGKKMIEKIIEDLERVPTTVEPRIILGDSLVSAAVGQSLKRLESPKNK